MSGTGPQVEVDTDIIGCPSHADADRQNALSTHLLEKQPSVVGGDWVDRVCSLWKKEVLQKLNLPFCFFDSVRSQGKGPERRSQST
jgi:hypothetical protein